jgi:hypothetical protein
VAKWDVWTGKTYRLRNGDGASAGSRIPVKLLPRESMLIAVGPEAAATDGPLIDPDTLTPVAQLADWDLTGSESPGFPATAPMASGLIGPVVLKSAEN